MPNTNLISLLERLLDDARSGEMVGFQYTSFLGGGGRSCGFVNCEESDLSSSQQAVRRAAEDQISADSKPPGKQAFTDEKGEYQYHRILMETARSPKGPFMI